MALPIGPVCEEEPRGGASVGGADIAYYKRRPGAKVARKKAGGAEAPPAGRWAALSQVRATG